MKYCINKDCPITDCEKHLINASANEVLISVAAFDSVCTDYLILVLEEVQTNISVEEI